MQSLRLSIRTLRKSPVFTGVAILSLALGIGANTAMFTLVDQVLLRLLPVERPDQLVQFRLMGGRFGAQNGDGRHTFSHPEYLAFRDRNTVLSGLTGARVERVSLVGESGSEMVGVGMVAGNFFEVLGVRPHLGRLLTADDDRQKNGHPVAVLQYDFWRNRFGGRETIAGETIRINGSPFTVIGVASPGFEGTDPGIPTNIWVPVMMKTAITPTWDALDDTRWSWFYLFGRLKPGVSAEQAQASLRVLYRQMQEEALRGAFFARFPELKDRYLRQTFSLIPASRGQSMLRERFEEPLLVLQCLVGLVLLIACANLASLLLARAAARQREQAIRTALGASRRQIFGQLLAESSLLALAGGAAGLLLSVWLSRALIGFLPYDPANLSLSAAPDLRILLFTMGVTLLTALLFGTTPAVHGSRVSPSLTLKEASGPVAGGHGHLRLRKTLVGLQVGLCTVMIIGAGLFARSLSNLRNVNLGFCTTNVITFAVRPGVAYEPGHKLQLFRTLIESLQRVPGVQAVGANSTRLMTGGRWDSSVTIPGAIRSGDDYPWSFFNAISPGYFDALGVPVKAGRDFNWNDWGAAKSRALVNEALVQAYFGGANPIGRMMALGRENHPDIEIIGVFGDAHYHEVRGEVPRQTFITMGSERAMRSIGAINVYARVAGDPRPLMAALRKETTRVDVNLVVSGMRLMDEELNQRLSNERLLSFLSVGFATLATLLAVIGLYGVLAFVVARRTREIGIRMAMGAEQGSVVRLVLREVALLVALGVAGGVACGLAAGRYVESQLFGVSAIDPAIYLSGVAALLAASLAAGFIPAWRASRMDPMRALRSE